MSSTPPVAASPGFAVEAHRLEISPHPDADRIELARVGGYLSIVPKGLYRDGDYALYIPEQSIVPAPILEELGLTGKLAGSEKNRVKAMRLRGILSQGLIYRPKRMYLQEGHDYAAELGIVKWEAPIPVELSGQVIQDPAAVGYHDIENIKRFPDVLIPGEEVAATEKSHGCLRSDTRILMADLTWRPIRELVDEGFAGEVMGVDANGQLIPTPVLNTFDNGPRGERPWWRLQVSKVEAGRGPAWLSVYLTDNHRIWSPDNTGADAEGFVRTDEIKVGDEVFVSRTDLVLPPMVEQILVGTMLGDGSLAGVKTSGVRRVEFSHMEPHREYVDWTLAHLGEWAHPVTSRRTSGYGTEMIAGSTITSALIAEMFVDWFGEDGRKRFPESAIPSLGPLAVACWYMDDGSLQRNAGQLDQAMFATNGFDPTSIQNLVAALERLGLHATVRNYERDPGNGRIHLNAENTERMAMLIAPFIPPVMQYKLPAHYRGSTGWMPSAVDGFKPVLRPQRVMSVEPYHGASGGKNRLYDLETGTANFIANGLVVHNSCSNFSLVDGHFAVTSKGQGRKGLALLDTLDEKGESTNAYWKMAKKFAVEERLREFAERTGAQRITLFGETLGVQDLNYGADNGHLDFRAFDIQVDGRFLDHDEKTALFAQMGIPDAPVLYRGPHSIEALEQAASGSEQISGRELHMREGVVVRPVSERTDPTLGRVILKVISPDYLTRKGGTEFN